MTIDDASLTSDLRSVVLGMPLSEEPGLGPLTIAGYVREVTRFFCTGDGGYVDAAGRLFWEGRLTEIIKTGGANVSPAEIDAVIGTFPGVKLTQTVGVPHETLSEMVVSCIVPQEHKTLDADALREFLKQRLASFKAPREILVFREEEFAVHRQRQDQVQDAAGRGGETPGRSPATQPIARSKSALHRSSGGIAMSNGDSGSIIQAINLYGFAVDSQRWDLFDRIFTADVDADYSATAHWRSLETFKADFAAFHAPFDSTQHCMMNHLVHVDGDQAQAFTYGTWRLVRRAAEGLPLWDGSGWYEDDVVRTAAGWRIKHRTCRVVWWTGNPLVNETIPGVRFELNSTVLRREAQAGNIRFLNAIAPK